MDGEERIAEKRQSANEIGVSATRMIFPQTGILAPMEPVFDSGPVVPDRPDPLFGSQGIVLPVADVIPIFLEGHSPAVADMQDVQSTTSMWEVDFQGFDRGYSDAPAFDASMPFLENVKKGEAAVRRAKRALMVGWLPLTWRR